MFHCQFHHQVIVLFKLNWRQGQRKPLPRTKGEYLKHVLYSNHLTPKIKLEIYNLLIYFLESLFLSAVSILFIEWAISSSLLDMVSTIIIWL